MRYISSIPGSCSDQEKPWQYPFELHGVFLERGDETYLAAIAAPAKMKCSASRVFPTPDGPATRVAAPRPVAVGEHARRGRGRPEEMRSGTPP